MRVVTAVSLFAAIVSMLFSGAALSAAETKARIVYSGYYSRQGNDGKMAEMSGKSHYVKFYPGNRVIRLYIPYPYSKQLTPSTISKVFKVVNSETTGNAYIRDTFGLLTKPIIAHLDVYRIVDGQVMFDCGSSAPCVIEFTDDAINVIKRGIVKDHVIKYLHVKEALINSAVHGEPVEP